MQKLYVKEIRPRTRQSRAETLIRRIPQPIRIAMEYIAGYFIVGVAFLFAVALLAQ